jgi:hypothetical protein
MFKIKEIDISKQARALQMLRLTDYVLVILCGSWLLGTLSGMVVDPEGWAAYLFMAAILFFSVYTGCRHIGVIDARVWRAYMFAFPMLLLLCIAVAFPLFTNFVNNGWESLKDPQIIAALLNSLWASVAALLGFVAVLLLRRTRIASLGIPLVELLGALRNQSGLQALSATSIKRVNTPRGILFGVGGIIILMCLIFTPIPNDFSKANPILRFYQQINLLGFFLLVRARRYLQVNADSLLAVDKRNPILFLRSFDDDEKQIYSTSEKAILDFSLETRLSNHFTYFGPFIAIGSPKETVPVPGAARILLTDNEWQPKVMGWMPMSLS